MNKIVILFSVLSLFMGCGASTTHGGALVVENLQRQSPLTTCSAQVFCPQNGRVAHCAVYANPFYGQRCTWEAYPAFGVRCRGWDAFGNWVVYEDYCLRW